MAKEKIEKYDLISEGAINTWEKLNLLLGKTEKQLLSLIEVGPKLDKSLKGSTNIETVSKNIDRISKSIEKLIDVQKKLDTLNKNIINLNKKKIQEEEKAARVAKAAANEVKKAREIEERATLKAANASAKFNAEIDAHAKKMHAAKQSGNTFRNGLNNLIGSLKGLLLAYVGVNSVMGVFGSILNNTKKLDSLDFSIRKVIQDNIEFTQTQNYLNKLIVDYGLNLFDTTQSYIKFRAAIGATNLSVEEGQSIFESFAKTSAILGLSQEQTNGVFLALEQMISKGKITTEELRRQLGERIPGAFNIMANALGVTVVQLDKMLRKGEVLSEEALPKMAREMEKTFGIENVTKVDTVVAAQERLNTAWTNFVKILEGSGVFIKAYNTLADAMSRINQAITPDKNIISKRSADLVSGVVGKLSGITDEEERRKILIEEVNKLYEKRVKLDKILTEYDKKRPGLIEKTLSFLNRGLGLGGQFTSAINFEDMYQDTILDNKAYSDAIKAIKENFDKFAKVPIKKIIPGDDEEDGKDKFASRFQIFKARLESEFNAYKESREMMRRQAYVIKRDQGASELELEQVDAGLKMDLEKDLLDYREGMYTKLLNFAKGREKQTTEVIKAQNDDRADYAKKYTDFLIKEDDRAYSEHVRSLKAIKDADLAAIEERMNAALFTSQHKLTGDIKNAKPRDFDNIYSQNVIESLLITKSSLEQMLEVENLTSEEILNIKNNLFNAEKALEEAKRSEYEKTAKQKAELEKRTFELSVNAINSTFDLLSSFQQGRMQQLEYDYEREKNLAGDNVDAKIAAENKYDKEKRKIQRRQAILNKVSSAFSIIADTAQAIMATLAETGFFGAPLIPFIAGIGAVQLATVLAQPIPAYEEGGRHEGGIARFSEHGKSELFIPDNGIPYLTPEKETISNMPKGVFVPHNITKEILSNSVSNNDASLLSGIQLTETNMILNKIANKEETIINKGFKIVKKSNIFGKYATGN